MFYITDWHDQAVIEIEKFHRESAWRALTPPWPAGSLLEPAGMALSNDGRLIVADRGHHRLIVFSSDRTSAFAIAPDLDLIGSLWQPNGVSIGLNSDVLIADTGNHRIVRCDSVDAPAWTTFGSVGTAEGQFAAPTGIARDSTGRILITDPGTSRLVRVDAMDGTGWVELPLPPAPVTARPYGCAVGLGGVLVADPGTARVLLVADNGAGGETITTVIDGSIDKSIISPIAVVEVAGALFVADAAGASIAHFVPVEPEDGGGWRLSSRLYGQRAAFPSPLFPRIGGFTTGVPL